MIETFIGFDSAWTDNRTNPGAICSISWRDSKIVDFKPPQLVSFREAAEAIKLEASRAEFTLLAIDQPTIVPNLTGSRAVEGVAGSVISAFGGGVQPASRKKASMFGDSAPIWRFLNDIRMRQNPPAARSAVNGAFAMEVFPALALASMVPETWDRRRAAKYNPANRKFLMDDWQLVTRSVSDHAARLGAKAIERAADAMRGIAKPRKSDQDRLDALICLVIALAWRRFPRDEMTLIGDGLSGYIVTPASISVRARLTESAGKRGVTVDAAWERDAEEMSGHFVDSTPLEKLPDKRTRPTMRILSEGKLNIGIDELRALLTHAASNRQTITYGEVAGYFGFKFHQGTLSHLTKQLNRLAEINIERQEPLLMTLVVNKSRNMPGKGFFDAVGANATDDVELLRIFHIHRSAVWDFDWSRYDAGSVQ